jgi:hypothetical protein
MSNFENYFEFLESDIEIRVESIKIQIDESLDKLHECVNKMEKNLSSKTVSGIKKLKKKKIRKLNYKIKLSCLQDLNKYKIGMIHDYD